jgi:hypothetical protein
MRSALFRRPNAGATMGERMSRSKARGKCILAVAILCLCAAWLPAQDFTYVRSMALTAQTRVLIRSVSDFLDLVRKAKVDTIYALDPSGERVEEFYAWTGGYFIALRASGYGNLADYAAGLKLGFSSGAEYYASRELGMANKDEYDYWNAERFLSVKDMKAAIAAGYRGKGRDRDSYVFPRKVPERQYTAGFLDALAFASLMEGVSLPLDPSTRELASKHGFKLPAAGTTISVGAKGADRERFTAGFRLLREYLARENRLGKVEYRASGGAWVSATVPSFGGTGGDASLWYFSRAYGEPRIADFLERYTILASGFDSKQDEAAASRAGFPGADDYYAALSVGFDNYRDYGGARALSLADLESWLPYRERLRELSDLMARLGIFAWPEGLVALQLSQVPAGKAISLEKAAELANAYAEANKDLRKLLGERTSAAAVRALIQSRREPFARLGELDAEGANFTRK